MVTFPSGRVGLFSGEGTLSLLTLYPNLHRHALFSLLSSLPPIIILSSFSSYYFFVSSIWYCAVGNHPKNFVAFTSLSTLHRLSATQISLLGGLLRQNIFHVGVLGFNGLVILTNNKWFPKLLILIYVRVLVFGDLLWVEKALQDIACSTNANADIISHGFKTSKIQSCEAQTVQLMRNISCVHSQISSNRILNEHSMSIL